jgi:hypothetical protein
MSTALHLLRVDGHDSDTLLAMLERQLRQLVRLVDDLLDVSRITQGKITLRTERVTIAEIVARALETVRPTIEGRAQRLDVLLPDEPIDLDADAARLAQVLANLLDNAAKYTPHGGTVVLSARREGSVVVVGVRDTGAGLLRSSYRTSSTRSCRAITRSRARAAASASGSRSSAGWSSRSGRVQAKSAGLGLGSEFVVELPALPAEAGARAVEAVLPATPARAAAGLRVLVVEDNPDAAAVSQYGVQEDVRQAFLKGGSPQRDTRYPRAANDDWPVFAHSWDLGKVDKPVVRRLVLGHARRDVDRTLRLRSRRGQAPGGGRRLRPPPRQTPRPGGPRAAARRHRRRGRHLADRLIACAARPSSVSSPSSRASSFRRPRRHTAAIGATPAPRPGATSTTTC